MNSSSPNRADKFDTSRANEYARQSRIALAGYDACQDLAADASYDAATLIGVLHHLEGDDAKGRMLRSIRAHLKPGAPLIVAGNHYAYASQPLLLTAWGQRWRQHGATPDEVKAKLGKILQGADPPHSEAAVQKLLHDAGFGDATRFFSSLFWGAWLTCKAGE